MNIDILYAPHMGIRLPPRGRVVLLDVWIATDDLQTCEGRRYVTAGAVRWPSDLRGVASVTLPFEFPTQDQAREAARNLVAFLTTYHP